MTTPREVFDRLSEGISEQQWSELSALYAEDAVVEHPQRVPRPSRIEGREALHEHFTGALAGSMRLKRHDCVVYETTDPEVIVAEFKYTAESLQTGKSCEVDNIQVLRVRDGLIVHTRDYHDYLRLAALRDGVDDLAEAFRQAPPRELSPAQDRPPLSPAGTPRGVFERLVYGVSDGLFEEVAELYAEETHVTHPFRPTAAVRRSRAEVREQFAARRRREFDVEARNLVTYQGVDPEVLIAEFDYEGTMAGTPVKMSNIYAMRIRDGLIVESHDYPDYLGFAGDAGRIPELAAPLLAAA